MEEALKKAKEKLIPQDVLQPAAPIPETVQTTPETPADKSDKMKFLEIFNFLRFRKKKKITTESGEEIEVEDDEDDPGLEGSNPADGDEIQPATKEDCLNLLRESFDGYDYNGNGTIAQEEVREAWMMCQEEWNQTSDPERCNLEASNDSNKPSVSALCSYPLQKLSEFTGSTFKIFVGVPQIFMKDIDIDSKNHVTFEDYVVYFQHLWRMSMKKDDSNDENDDHENDEK